MVVVVGVVVVVGLVVVVEGLVRIVVDLFVVGLVVLTASVTLLVPRKENSLSCRL